MIISKISDPWWKGNFFNRYRSTLGYSSSTLYDYTRTTYKSYESRFTKPGDRDKVFELLKSAYKSVRDIVIILDFPFPIKICFSRQSFTTVDNDKTRNLFLPTNCLDDVLQPDSRKIDVLCGYGVHEAAHLRYSEVRVLEGFLKANKSGDEKLILTLINLLEDERVEDKLLKERPGYLTYLNSKKDWEFEHNKRFKAISFVDASDIFSMIVRFIRYKDKFSEETILPEYKDLFLKIGELISPIYNDSDLTIKNICLLGKELYNIIEEELRLSSRDIDKIVSAQYCTSIISGQDGDISDYVFPLGSYFPSTNLVDDVWLTAIEKITSGKAELVDNNNCFFQKIEIHEHEIKDYIQRYNSIKEEISKYVPSIRRVLMSQSKNYDFTIHGCRSGLLDTTKLAEAYQGVPQVYQRIGHVFTSKLVVCIVIDESGSMERYGKIDAARKTAILLNEGLSCIPGLELFIYGHTADYLMNRSEYGITSITVYKEPGMRKNSYLGLTEIESKYENRDGDALINISNRIRKFTNEYCLMFVISDGEPEASDYHGYSAIRDTAKKINLIEKTKNMDVIGVCIDSFNAHDIYSKVIDLTDDLSNFAKNFGKIVKDNILSSRLTSITSS